MPLPLEQCHKDTCMCLQCVVLWANGTWVCSVQSSGTPLLPVLLWTAGKSSHCCSWDVISASSYSPYDTRWLLLLCKWPPLLLFQFAPLLCQCVHFFFSRDVQTPHWQGCWVPCSGAWIEPASPTVHQRRWRLYFVWPISVLPTS